MEIKGGEGKMMHKSDARGFDRGGAGGLVGGQGNSIDSTTCCGLRAAYVVMIKTRTARGWMDEMDR